ncbi:MAG TPA: cytochrome c biogenesis protein ResB [Mycobacteriales bacterium]|nr:cytochrome c biogenesis protein ResB [Mycobacteriales bacterium]
MTAGPDTPVRDADVDPAELSTQPAPVRSWHGGPIAFARNSWRRLTSMRTALVLLFLLALASIPGSLLPQRALNPGKVDAYIADHPGWSRILDAAGFFDVFAAPWFAATYLLLFVSLIGCVVPRLRQHATAMLSAPPVVPRRLDRLAQSSSFSSAQAPAEAARAAVSRLRGWKTVIREEDDGVVTVAAEKGYLRETGNLVFHAALVVLLVGVAAGKLWGYQGTVLLTEAQPGICNAVPLYDSFRPGKLVDGAGLAPFCIDSLDKFTATYDPDGTPSSFKADITYSLGENGAPKKDTLQVNHPLRVEGVRVYLVGHGFAPRFTVTTPQGKVLRDITAPFLPQVPSTLLSEGAVKLLDTVNPQLALYGSFAPFAALDSGGKLTSLSPQPGNPGVAIVVYQGDLGVDSGAPQSVYSIDQRQVASGRLKAVQSAQLTQGKSVKLSDGTQITFDGYRQWATIQVNHDPGQTLVLWSAGAIVLGLLLSLAVRRRRLFLRITPADSSASRSVDNSEPVDDAERPEPDARSVVAVGGLARTDAGSFGTEFARVIERLRDPSPVRKD